MVPHGLGGLRRTGSKPFLSLPGGEEKILLVDDDENGVGSGKIGSEKTRL